MEANQPSEAKDRRQWHRYVLQLEHGMYYVGITTRIKARYEKHCAGQGALWTALHRPLRIVETTPSGTTSFQRAENLETARTVELFAEHGWRNVRGGKFTIVDDKFHLNHLANCFRRFRDEPEVAEWLELTPNGKYRVPSIVVAFGNGDGRMFKYWNEAQEFLTGKNNPHWKIFHENDLQEALRWLRLRKGPRTKEEFRPIARNAILQGRASKSLARLAEPEWNAIAAIFGDNAKSPRSKT